MLPKAVNPLAHWRLHPLPCVTVVLAHDDPATLMLPFAVMGAPGQTARQLMEPTHCPRMLLKHTQSWHESKNRLLI